MECLKLTVQVLLLVAGVGISVQADTVRVVKIDVAEHNCVPALAHVGFIQKKALVTIDISSTDDFVIDDEVSDRDSLEVDPEVTIARRLLQIEIHDGFAHVVRAFVDGDLKVVLYLGYELKSAFSLTSLQGDILIVAWVEVGAIAEVLGHEGTRFTYWLVSLLLLCVYHI